jgi:hypothetical protein
MFVRYVRYAPVRIGYVSLPFNSASASASASARLASPRRRDPRPPTRDVVSRRCAVCACGRPHRDAREPNHACGPARWPGLAGCARRARTRDAGEGVMAGFECSVFNSVYTPPAHGRRETRRIFACSHTHIVSLITLTVSSCRPNPSEGRTGRRDARRLGRQCSRRWPTRTRRPTVPRSRSARKGGVPGCH